MIARLLIRQLYGTYDYDIPFFKDQRVTILTGPNGYGKTTILRIVNHLLSCHFWYFYTLPFEDISVFFNNGYQLTISKQKVEEDTHREDKYVFAFRENVLFSLNDKDGTDVENFMLTENNIQYLRRQLPYAYRNLSIEDIDWEELFSQSEDIEWDDCFSGNSRNIRMFLQDRKCVFIKEQRIIHSSRDFESRRITFRYEIEDIARQLRQEFIRQQTEFANHSQGIDSTFIKRLMGGNSKKYDETTYQDKLSSLKEKIDAYRKYGLVPQIDIQEAYPEPLQQVLSLYLDDMEYKMASFDRFYRQLSLLDHFVTDKILSNKHVEFNESKGICVLNDRGDEVPLHRLSSGEQNLIILCYKLAFSTDTRTLLLIDEPENSLHMVWISRMLEDYLCMADELKCQVIIATHSPAFINDRWDLTVDLFLNHTSGCNDQSSTCC